MYTFLFQLRKKGSYKEIISNPKYCCCCSVTKSCQTFCCPHILLPSIFPSIGVFSIELALHIRRIKYWNFSFSISPSNGWFPLGLIGLSSLQSKGLSRVFSNILIWKHQFLSAQPSSWSNSHIHTWLLEKPWLWLYWLLVKWKMQNKITETSSTIQTPTIIKRFPYLSSTWRPILKTVP